MSAEPPATAAPSQPSDLLTVAEVARFLRVAPKTVRGLIRRRELAAYDGPGRYLVAPTDLDDFMARRRLGARRDSYEDFKLPRPGD